MSAILLPIDIPALRRVIAGMRAWDREEIFATRRGDDNEAFATDIARIQGPKWIAWVSGMPVAAIGIMPCWHGVWSPWCFGTDDFHHAKLVLTRLGKRVIIPYARLEGARRLEVRSIEGHANAQGWLEKCFGCHREATHPNYGRDGQTFHTYALML
jgi:hypothetical protein